MEFETKEVDLEKEIQAFAKMYLYPIELSDTNLSIIVTKHQIYECARHFFNLGLKAKEKYIKDIPLQCWQIPCADPNYPCENPQMDCINCPRFGHPQGTITKTSVDEKESEQGLVGKETFKTGSWSDK